MGLGWGTFFGAIGKIIDKLPLQGRKERWKNELENLGKERVELIKGVADLKKTKRVIEIDQRVSYLNQLIKNSTQD